MWKRLNCEILSIH